MKKIAMFLVVLLAAAPAMAVVTVTATQVGTTNEVDITATHSGEGTIPRAYALDITVDAGQITGISNFFSGEGTTAGKGYGIFPANFNRWINADDPCWGEPNYTPVALPGDLPGDTEGGIDTNGITIEMGSLYTGANSPPSPATLCRIAVTVDCNVVLAVNIGRGKIVLEDGNAPSSTSLIGCHVAIICTVPDVVDMAEADAIEAIEEADFVAGTPTYECSDTIAVGNVISTTPGAGEATCGSTVEIVVSTGPCLVDVPNIVGMLESAAETAVTDAGCTVGVQTYVWDNSVLDCTVTIQSPTACTSCVAPGTAVNMTIARNWLYPACWDWAGQCLGDCEGDDGDVDIDDFLAFKAAFATVKGNAAYNPCADLDRDGDIDIDDFLEFKKNFADTGLTGCPPGDINLIYQPVAPPTGGGC